MKQSDRKDALLEWLLCPKSGGNTRTQIRSHTVKEAAGTDCVLRKQQNPNKQEGAEEK